MNHFLIMTGIRPVGAVWATMGGMPEPVFLEETRTQAVALGRRLVESWENKVTVPGVEKEISEFKERMRLLMMYRKEDWPYEWEYWNKHRE